MLDGAILPHDFTPPINVITSWEDWRREAEMRRWEELEDIEDVPEEE